MNNAEPLYCEKPKAMEFAKGYLDYLTRLLAEINLASVEAFIQVLLEARERGARVFFIGNGGSAATASHFANDMSIGSRAWNKPFRAVSLTDNVAILTAIGNDYGYDEIFTRQLQTQMKSGDVVVAISASGNSPNVVKAIEYANVRGAITVALTGFDGGKLRKMAGLGIHVTTNKGEYGPTEDVHLILNHLVGAFLMAISCGESERKL